MNIVKEKIFPILLLIVSASYNIYAQESDIIQMAIRWNNTDFKKGVLTIDNNGVYNDGLEEVQAFSYTQPYKNTSIEQAQLLVQASQIISITDSLSSKLTDDYIYNLDVIEIRNKYQLQLFINPIRKINNTQAEIITKFTIHFQNRTIASPHLRNPNATYQSVLSSGDIYKIKVNKTGLYKIDKTLLENQLGINVNNLNPKKIKIYGNRGGRVPEANNLPREDDLKQLSIFISGEADGKFDANDYILFYAEGADLWSYNNDTKSYVFDKNIYDDLQIILCILPAITCILQEASGRFRAAALAFPAPL